MARPAVAASTTRIKENKMTTKRPVIASIGCQEPDPRRAPTYLTAWVSSSQSWTTPLFRRMKQQRKRGLNGNLVQVHTEVTTSWTASIKFAHYTLPPSRPQGDRCNLVELGTIAKGDQCNPAELGGRIERRMQPRSIILEERLQAPARLQDVVAGERGAVGLLGRGEG